MTTQIRDDLIGIFLGAGRSHIGGYLSIVEVMTVLYFHIMKVDPRNPKWPDRGRFVLLIGHASVTWYAVLAEKGFFSKDLLFNSIH